MRTTSRRVSAVAVLFALLLCPTFVAAQSWSGAFNGRDVDRKLSSDSLRFAVAAAGSRESASGAADRFRRALRRASAVSTVIDGSDVTGELSTLDDAEIVERLSGLPVDRIAVVRTYSSSSDQRPAAVATIYEPSGDAVASLTARAERSSGKRSNPPEQSNDSRPPGEPEGAEKPSPRADSGRSEDTSRETTSASDSAHTDGSTPPASDPPTDTSAYDRNFIWFEEARNPDETLETTSLSEATIFVGTDKTAVEGPAFYERMGHPELASEYRRNRTLKDLALGGAWSVLGYGVLYSLNPGFANPLCFGGCSRLPGLGLAFAGLLTGTLIHGKVRVHPVSMKRARSLVDTHNEKLRDKHGISESYDPFAAPKRTSANGPDYGVGLGIAKDGVRATFRLRF